MEALIVWTVVLVGGWFLVAWIRSDARKSRTIVGPMKQTPPTASPDKPMRLTLWQRFVAWL
jgi:hypothetical protein